MIPKKIHFKLFANCILVRGATRSTICDIQQGNFKLIPNLLADILEQNNNKTVDELKSFFNNQYDKGIDSYFKKLEEENLGFFTNEPERFPKLDLSFEFPAQITNAIIDLDKKSDYISEKIFQDLDKLGCCALQLRIYDVISLNRVGNILNHTVVSRLESIELVLKFSDEITDETLENLCKNHKRINSILIHSSPNNRQVHKEKLLLLINYLKISIDSQTHCGIISPQYFSINIPTFTESQKYNTCLNRKISIDTKGEIKNCPSMPQSYGNIKDTTLVEALNKNGFKDVWYIHKDQIKVCQDCEFRHICTDCRAYIQDTNNPDSKPAKCSYDPYRAIWGEISPNNNLHGM